jgi:hypothetical protein
MTIKIKNVRLLNTGQELCIVTRTEGQFSDCPNTTVGLDS